MPLINIFLLIIAFGDIKLLDNELIKKMFGVFYEDFEKKKKEGLMYMIIYFLRRDVFILVAFVMANKKYQAC